MFAVLLDDRYACKEAYLQEGGVDTIANKKGLADQEVIVATFDRSKKEQLLFQQCCPSGIRLHN